MAEGGIIPIAIRKALFSTKEKVKILLQDVLKM